tara:strand:+ start:430 stop:1410 length:981 start_codon:yes stop_codon:yes gene_type:complete
MENKEAFFELLKNHRISQGIEISDICEFTKINARYIEAIEVGDFKVLPTVYMRLFLRAYAKFIKSDHVKALEDYELFTTGKILDNSDLSTAPNKELNAPEGITSISHDRGGPQIPPQKIATIAIVSLGLIAALYWAGKVTGDQSIQTKKSEPSSSTALVQSASQDTLKSTKIENINSDIKSNNNSNNSNPNTKIKPGDEKIPSNQKTYLNQNSYSINNRISETTTIIQTSPPYNINITTLQKTRVNISKSNGDNSKVLVNGIIDKDENLKFTFESIINFDFINNSHVEVMINNVPLKKYFSNNGLAIRGSYRSDNSQLYIGFYSSN